MSDKHSKKEQQHDELQDTATSTEENSQEQTQENAENAEATSDNSAEIELAEMKDKYIRLMAEFENFRRRTTKERLDLLKTANQDLMSELLPVLDDMDRAAQSIETAKSAEAVAEGLELVFHKLKNVTQLKGLKEMGTKSGDEFDVEQHEAVTQIPAPSEDLKGKIVDVIEKGYTLNEKVIRFAKVIIGA